MLCKILTEVCLRKIYNLFHKNNDNNYDDNSSTDSDSIDDDKSLKFLNLKKHLLK